MTDARKIKLRIGKRFYMASYKNLPIFLGITELSWGYNLNKSFERFIFINN